MPLTINDHIEAAREIIKKARAATRLASSETKRDLGLVDTRLEIIRGMLPNEIEEFQEDHVSDQVEELTQKIRWWEEQLDEAEVAFCLRAGEGRETINGPQ